MLCAEVVVTNLDSKSLIKYRTKPSIADAAGWKALSRIHKTLTPFRPHLYGVTP